MIISSSLKYYLFPTSTFTEVKRKQVFTVDANGSNSRNASIAVVAQNITSFAICFWILDIPIQPIDAFLIDNAFPLMQDPAHSAF